MARLMFVALTCLWFLFAAILPPAGLPSKWFCTFRQNVPAGGFLGNRSFKAMPFVREILLLLIFFNMLTYT